MDIGTNASNCDAKFRNIRNNEFNLVGADASVRPQKQNKFNLKTFNKIKSNVVGVGVPDDLKTKMKYKNKPTSNIPTSNIKPLTSNSAITIVALVITIIVLLILDGVTLNMVMGENGIIKKAQLAKNKTEEAQKKEMEDLSNLENYVTDRNAQGGTLFGIEGTTGDGTENNPWKITNASQMEALSALVNAGNTFEGKYFEMANSITLNYSENWIPIGKIDGYDINNRKQIGKLHCFMGNFDGKNNEIKGLHIEDNKIEDAGLFGVVYKGTIKNIKLSSENSLVTAKIRIGACIGVLIDGNVKNCENNIGVTVGDASAGGIIGYIIGTKNVVEDCKNNASINGNYIGGIVGYLDNSNVEIINCKNTGTIQSGKYNGGILGRNYNPSGKKVLIKNCTTTNGDIIGASYTQTGITIE